MSWHPSKSESVSVTCPKCGRIVMISRKDGKPHCSYCRLRELSEVSDMKWNCPAKHCPDRTGKLKEICKRCGTYTDRHIDCPQTYCEAFPDEVNKDSEMNLAHMTADKDEQTCRVCGCTWDNACEGGCYWVEDDLCSKCANERVSEDGSSKDD